MTSEDKGSARVWFRGVNMMFMGLGISILYLANVEALSLLS